MSNVILLPVICSDRQYVEVLRMILDEIESRPRESLDSPHRLICQWGTQESDVRRLGFGNFRQPHQHCPLDQGGAHEDGNIGCYWRCAYWQERKVEPTLTHVDVVKLYTSAIKAYEESLKETG